MDAMFNTRDAAAFNIGSAHTACSVEAVFIPEVIFKTAFLLKETQVCSVFTEIL